LLSFLVTALEIGHSLPVTASSTRARVRAELTREILDTARRHLADAGAAGLSLRAVARDVGMVSSAVYRYFPSRDHLLTALIVDAYDGLGATVETATAAVRPGDLARRWTTIARTIRSWALAHPHEYALIYGSPVPGYRAPRDTIGPATRVANVLVQLLVDAAETGALREAPLHGPIPRSVRPDLTRLHATFATVPDAVIVRALTAWSALFGLVSFELFGQFHDVIDANAEYFDVAVRELGAFVGLPVGRSRGPGAVEPGC
jgi:AcrR family transcriptional regulator